MMSHSRLPQHRTVTRSLILASAAALLLAGCANPWQRVQAGASQSDLVAKLGPPKEVYTLPDGNKRLLWPTRPLGETTTAAVVNPAGVVVNIEQALTVENFSQAQVGVWTQHDVQARFGLPEETGYFAGVKLTVWTYRYQQNNYWYMLYNFYFDDKGILRTTQNMVDPLRDPSLNAM
jgi:hypothetical protein